MGERIRMDIINGIIFRVTKNAFYYPKGILIPWDLQQRMQLVLNTGRFMFSISEVN